MAFSFTNSRGKTYFLHARTTTSKGGKARTLYYFSGTPGAGAIPALPPGYVVAETKSGLPVLKKK